MVFTSEWNKNRWREAREKKNFYSQKFGEDISTKEFYKNENPLLSKVITYEVSIDMDYHGEGYEFFAPQETYKITSLVGFESKANIEEQTKLAVSEIFKGNARDWVYKNINVEARGIERKEIKYNDETYKDLLNSKYSFKDLPKITFGKGKNKGHSNKNSYSLDLWF